MECTLQITGFFLEGIDCEVTVRRQTKRPGAAFLYAALRIRCLHEASLSKHGSASPHCNRRQFNGPGDGGFLVTRGGSLFPGPCVQRDRTAPFSHGALNNGSDSLEDSKDPFLDCSTRRVSDAAGPAAWTRPGGCQYTADDHRRCHWRLLLEWADHPVLFRTWVSPRTDRRIFAQRRDNSRSIR